jgi:hypothetical protein
LSRSAGKASAKRSAGTRLNDAAKTADHSLLGAKCFPAMETKFPAFQLREFSLQSIQESPHLQWLAIAQAIAILPEIPTRPNNSLQIP